MKNRYHAPSDDLNQPVDKPAAAEFNRIMLDVGERVADAADRPHWNEKSFFKRFAKGMGDTGFHFTPGFQRKKIYFVTEEICNA